MSLVVALFVGDPFIKMINCKILLQYFIYTPIKPQSSYYSLACQGRPQSPEKLTFTP